jgi:two-component system cell cycle response regulator DivK
MPAYTAKPERIDGMQKHLVMISGRQQDSRYMMRVLLELWGYDVIEADGTDETVRLAEEQRPQVILVDTSRAYDEDMRVIEGIRSSALSAAVPVIVLSGFPQASYQKAAFKSGATGLLVKPLDLDLLESYLETSIDSGEMF